MLVMMTVSSNAWSPLSHKTSTVLSAPKVLETIVEAVGAKLEPVFPGATNPALFPYFQVEIADQATAERLASRLRSCHAIEAVYIKPEDGLP
jgi:hypothetical protein